MTYLEQLKKSKTSTVTTAKAAKTPFDSFYSTDSTRFQKITSGTEHPVWCRADCPRLEVIALPNEGAVVGCVNFEETWRRLEQMSGCPQRRK